MFSEVTNASVLRELKVTHTLPDASVPPNAKPTNSVLKTRRVTDRRARALTPVLQHYVDQTLTVFRREMSPFVNASLASLAILKI